VVAAPVSCGALVGAAVPGALFYSPALFSLQTKLGPTWMPRGRAGCARWLDSARCARGARQAGRDSEKASFCGGVAGARRIIASLWPSVASHSIGAEATGPSADVARRVFEAAEAANVLPGHARNFQIRAVVVCLMSLGMSLLWVRAAQAWARSPARRQIGFLPEEHPRGHMAVCP